MAKEPKDKAPPDEEIEEVIRNVADRLAAARKSRGLTQAVLGAMADMTQQQVFGLEQGTANVTIRTLARVAKVLEIDLKSLFANVGPGPYSPLTEAMEQVAALLEERGVQEKALRVQIEELMERAKGDAACIPTGQNVDVGSSPASEQGESQKPKR